MTLECPPCFVNIRSLGRLCVHNVWRPLSRWCVDFRWNTVRSLRFTWHWMHTKTRDGREVRTAGGSPAPRVRLVLSARSLSAPRFLFYFFSVLKLEIRAETRDTRFSFSTTGGSRASFTGHSFRARSRLSRTERTFRLLNSLRPLD